MRSLSRWVIVFSLIGLGLVTASLFSASPAQSRPQATLIVYDDALENGWVDYGSWDTTVNYSNTTPKHGGTASISVKYNAAWAGLYIHADAVSMSGYDTLRFWIHGGSAGGQQLRVVANGAGSVNVTAVANTWTQIDVPLSALGSPATMSDLYWQDTTGGAQAIFYLDDIQFINAGLPTPTPTRTPTPAPTAVGPALGVDVQANRHAISPYIYGMNFADEDLAADLNLPVRRWGGNSTSRYNWQLSVHNTGSDWYFENIPDTISGTLPAGSDTNQFVEQDRRTGTKTLLTMPLIGWTPKRRVENHPYDCGFKVSKYGAQQSTDPWDTDCGNGVNGSGNITGNDPTDTSVAITTTFVISWINHLKSRYDTATNGGVMFYDLDNEPMLWNSTHRDVHPNPTSYDEMRDKTYAYAAAIKA
ncbi:MAG TPA: glycoside hydrolase family 44 protein, partial [Anaerolineae bacterium]|nr:glycoside hydrolase family 44 protein [Anaerolineae bacterium]